MILLLVAASNYFGAVFSRMGSASLIAESLLTLDLPPTLMLIVILAIIFVLGWPLEWVPIVLIVVPILLPAVQKLGIDLVWFCTLVAVCLQTAWLSPPVALSAYFLKGVVPEWDLKDIYAGMMQFMVLQVIGLLLVLFIPELALWLPRVLRE
jgi:TRAP-type mannitol/chloroaromatic compound transport system permease large subunit